MICILLVSFVLENSFLYLPSINEKNPFGLFAQGFIFEMYQEIKVKVSLQTPNFIKVKFFNKKILSHVQ